MGARFFHGKMSKEVSIEVEIELTENDIFNWLNDCSSPEVLRRLGRAALSFARALENSDDDDFRSRA